MIPPWFSAESRSSVESSIGRRSRRRARSVSSSGASVVVGGGGRRCARPAHRLHFGVADHAAPPGITAPQLFDHRPGPVSGSSTTSSTVISSGSTGVPSQGIRSTCSAAITRRSRFWIRPISFEERVEQLVARRAVAPDDLDDLVVITREETAADPGSAAVKVVRAPFPARERTRRRSGCRALFDFALAAVEGLVEVGEGLGQRLARGPGRLGLLGLDRPELFDRLPQCRRPWSRSARQAPAALGLELQLVPQGRELFDQIDDPEIPRRRCLGSLSRVRPRASSAGRRPRARAASSQWRNRSRMASTSTRSFMASLPGPARFRPEAGRRAACAADRPRSPRTSRSWSRS